MDVCTLSSSSRAFEDASTGRWATFSTEPGRTAAPAVDVSTSSAAATPSSVTPTFPSADEKDEDCLSVGFLVGDFDVVVVGVNEVALFFDVRFEARLAAAAADMVP